GILRCPRLPVELPFRERREPTRTTGLDHHLQPLPEGLQALLGKPEVDRALSLGDPVARLDQVWSRSRAIPRDRRVEVRQPEYGLVVRSLADRQAHHLGGLWRVAEALAPPVGTAREGARPLTRQVDPG